MSDEFCDMREAEDWKKVAFASEAYVHTLRATMREVAEELRRAATTAREHPTTEPIAPRLSELADRLDPLESKPDLPIEP